MGVGGRRVEFRIVGEPQPQGSMRSFVYHAKNRVTGEPLYDGNNKPVMRAALSSDNPNLKDWRGLVASGAGDAMLGPPFDGPVSIVVHFYLPRPKSLPRKVVAHTKKPDLDKLLRAIKDALKGVVYVDDSQVVEVFARKRYAVLDPVGVRVVVTDVCV